MTTTTTDDASFCFVFVLTTIKLITNDFDNTDNDNQLVWTISDYITIQLLTSH